MSYTLRIMEEKLAIRDCLNNGGSVVGLTRRALPGGED
jgi:hypothetical protein